MITAFVQFQLSKDASLKDATKIFESTAPRYLGMPGLLRKYYLFEPDTGVGGGCYLFQTRTAAEAVFNEDWRALIKDKYGAEPTIKYFETPVLVDNVSNEIVAGTKRS